MGCNYCFGCGADLAEDAKVCPSCGKRLDKLVNPPPLKVSEESRQAFKRNIPAPAKVQPKVIKTETAPVKRVFIKVPPTKGAVIGYGLMLLNALAGEAVFGYMARETIVSPFADGDLFYFLIVMLIFLPLIVIPIKKLKPRRIGSDQELVKKKTSVIRKTGGLLLLALVVLYVYYEVSGIVAFTKNNPGYPFYEYYSWDMWLALVTETGGLLSIAGMGIKQLFPQSVAQDKPPKTEEKPEQT